MNTIFSEKDNGNKDSFGNIFDNLSMLFDGTSSTESDNEVPPDFEEKCKKRSIVDLCYQSTCISFKDLAKRARLSTRSKLKYEKISEDVIIISSDDDESDATSSDELERVHRKDSLFVTEEDSDHLNDTAKLEKDDSTTLNKSTIECFFSPRKKEIKHRSPIAQKGTTGSHGKKPKNGPVILLGDSPVAKSFFSRTTLKENSDWKRRIGLSAPLLAQVTAQTITTSLRPYDFSTCQTDFIDGLSEDVMFYGVYIDAVLSFASASIAPSNHIVMNIFSKIAQCSDPATTLKAVNCLKRLLSMKTLTHRNFNLTWDVLAELASNSLNEVKANTASCSSCISSCSCDSINEPKDTIKNEDMGAKFSQLFLFVVSFLEEDLKRYNDSIRYCILRKILSPCLHGFSRIRKVGDWLDELLQTLERAGDIESKEDSAVITDSSSYQGDIGQCRAVENEICTEETADSEGLQARCCHNRTLQSKDEEPAAHMVEIVGKRLIQALQRLLHLTFLLSKHTRDEEQVFSEVFLNCFLELRTLRWRKILLSTIEPSLVQQTTAELILSTIFEDSTQFSEYQDCEKLSLEIIAHRHFYKKMPYESSRQARDENIELFLYLIWMLLRSYVALKHSKVCQRMGSLSVVIDQYKEGNMASGKKAMSLSDRQTLLYIKEEVDLLRGRILIYRGLGSLNSNSELILNLLKVFLENISD